MKFDKDNSFRIELIKIFMVCDFFLVCNFNVGFEKFLEKFFVCVDICIDVKILGCEVNILILFLNFVDVIVLFILGEFDIEIFVVNGCEVLFEGLEVFVDQVLEEVEEEEEEEKEKEKEKEQEEQELLEWFELLLGDVYVFLFVEVEGEGELLFEEEGGGEVVN